MSLMVPSADEFAPFYGSYIARVAHVSAPLDELGAQRSRVLTRLSSVSEAAGQYRYADGKWTVKELIGHLADVERVQAYRLLRIGRGDETPLPGFEEDDYVRAAHADRRRVADLVHEWAVVRDGTMALAAGLPDEAWAKRGTANAHTVTARALLYIMLGHVEHHIAVLQDRYGF